MYKKLLALTTCFLTLLHTFSWGGGTFTTPPTLIDASYTDGVSSELFCCYNSQTNEIFFTWNDSNTNGNPYYCIYNAKTNTFTTTPTLIDTSYTGGCVGSVFCCYNNQRNETVFSWAGYPNKNPYYCVYDALLKTFTIPPTLIDANYTQRVFDGVFCCYNSQNNEIIFSWADTTGTRDPYYCVYNALSKTFTTPPTLIDANYTQKILDNVFSCYNSQNNEIVFSWADTTGTRDPYYCVYNALSKTFITPPTLIDTSYTQKVLTNVFCCYNSQNNEIVFSWADTTGTRDPYYCVYDALSKTFTTQPTLIDASYTGSVSNDVYCCYNSANNQIFLSWTDNTGIRNPYYCTYNALSKTFTTLPTLIDASYTGGGYINVDCCYNSANNQVFFSWTDTTQNPYYAIYTEKFPASVAANRLLDAAKNSSRKFQKGVNRVPDSE